MVTQEVGTMIRLGFHPTIVVINNDGYTVERVIHGPAKPHNDVSPWNYQLMLRFFGGPEESRSFSARTYEELIPILDDEEFQSSKQIQVLECFLHKYDSPALLSNLVDLSASRMEWSVQQEDKRYHRSRVNLDGTLTQSGLSRHIQL
jgi:pyruvate decarboxylase